MTNSSKRTLRVRRETLAELTPTELTAMQAGQLTPVVQTMPLKNCVLYYTSPNGGCWETEACNSRSCDTQ